MTKPVEQTDTAGFTLLRVADRRKPKYHIYLFEPDKINGKMGWWYRFCIKVFLGARIERNN